MCGRFYVDDETMQEIEKIARKIDREKAKMGDVAPSQPSVVLQKLDEEIIARTVRWGYENAKGSGIIFNARSESVQTKPLFSHDFEIHRCLVPVRRFYEWKTLENRTKEQYDFYLPEKIMYLAGIYHRDPEGDRFAILTKKAEGCMMDVHDRMPVIIPEEKISVWFGIKEEAAKMLENSSLQLWKSRTNPETYEQLRLF